MSVGDELLTDAVPTAAALVCAVDDGDAEEVQTILTALGTSRLYALAVLLAANVQLESPLRTYPRGTLSPDAQCALALEYAAVKFDTTPTQILSQDRHRNVVDARATAMAACRLVGLSSTYIGERFRRDHTTVLAAAGRVGEDHRLRCLAGEVANQLGDRTLFGDPTEEVPA